MFTVNFKKEWRMNKPLLITFFAVCAGILAVMTAYYLITANLTLGKTAAAVIGNIFQIISGIAILISTVLPIVLMYRVLKADLGKNNVQYALFTPQSIYAWYLPKVLMVFIIQGLFSTFNLATVFLMGVTSVMPGQDQVVFAVESYLTATFAVDLFGLLTLLMAEYYSFRKKGTAWLLMVLTFMAYGALSSIYTIINVVKLGPGVTMTIQQSIRLGLIQYGIETVIGLIMMFIALQLFDKKVEY